MHHFFAIVTILLTLSLAACATKQYEVTTKTGETYIATGALDYDVKSETYKFKNENGKEVIINQEEIQVIQEKDK